MLQSIAATVDAWMDAVEPERRPWFEKARALALKHRGAETESMRYGLPT